MNFNLQVKDIVKETFLLTGRIDNKEIINNLIDFVRNNKYENLSYKYDNKEDKDKDNVKDNIKDKNNITKKNTTTGGGKKRRRKTMKYLK